MKWIVILVTTVSGLIAPNMGFSQIWEGDVNNDWNNQNNWSNNTFPYGQDVTIDAANYVNAPVMNANSSFGVQDITIQGTGTTLTFGANTSINGRGITVQSGATFTTASSINMYQDLTVTGTNTVVNLTGGSIGGRDIFVNSGAVLNNSGTSLTAWRDLVISGANTVVTFTGGTRAGRDVTVSDGAIFNNNGGVFTNYRVVAVSGPGSVINFSAGSFACADLNIDSASVVNMTGGTGSFNDDITINSGTLNVNGGSAVLNVTDDIILLAELSYFNLYNGDVNIGSDLVLSGDACNCNTVNANIYGGELLIDGALNVYTKNASAIDYPSLTISNGTVNIDGVTKSGAIGGRQLINVDGGEVNFNEAFTMDEGDTINQTDGTVSIQAAFTNNGMEYNVSGGKIAYDGDGYASLSGSSITEFYDLEINDPAGIEIKSHLYIRNKLSLINGIVAMSGAGGITLRDNATVEFASDSSFINGSVTKEGDDAFVFPVGNGTKYAPIGISTPSAYARYTARYYSYNGTNTHLVDTAGLYNVSTKEHWILTRDSGTGISKVTLYWENGTFSGINKVSELLVAEYNGAKWQSIGNSATSGDRYVGSVTSLNDPTSFSQYTFGSKSSTVNPLPVEWLYFDAHEENGDVVLDWATASEKNNDYFTIERTVDGTHYEVLGTVKGSGTTVNISEYTFTDTHPLNGEAFYRIRQVDYNGENKTTKWEKVSISTDAIGVEAASTVYPNPAILGSEITYELTGFATGDINVTIQTQTGKIVSANEVANVNGVISLSAIHQPGIYYINFIQGDIRVATKLIVR